jgi:hypothetical protein
LQGIIKKIGAKNIEFVSSTDWEYVEGSKNYFSPNRQVEVSLLIKPELIDLALENLHNVLEIEIKEGKIIGLTKIIPKKSFVEEYIESTFFIKEKGLREQYLQVMQILNSLETSKGKGNVTYKQFKTEIVSQLKCDEKTADKLIKNLLKEGNVYEPREGYITKT